MRWIHSHKHSKIIVLNTSTYATIWQTLLENQSLAICIYTHSFFNLIIHTFFLYFLEVAGFVDGSFYFQPELVQCLLFSSTLPHLTDYQFRQTQRVKSTLQKCCHYVAVCYHETPIACCLCLSDSIWKKKVNALLLEFPSQYCN